MRNPGRRSREHTDVVLQAFLGHLPSTTPRMRLETPGPNMGPYVGEWVGPVCGTPRRVKGQFGLCGPILGPVPDFGTLLSQTFWPGLLWE